MNSEAQEWKDHYQTALDGWAKSRKEINQLRAERDSLRADKERLDWLERSGNGICLIHDDHSRWACGLPGMQPVTQDANSICDGPIGGAWTYLAEPTDWKPSARAAIDLARAERKEQ